MGPTVDTERASWGSMLGLPRALVAILVAGIIVVSAVLLPLPPPLMIGLIVVGLIVGSIVWLVS